MPSAILRWAAVGLIATLLCVPSLTRAGQQIDARRGVNLSAGYSKAGNRPPDPVRAPDVGSIASTVETIVEPVWFAFPPVPEFLPRSPLLIDAHSLRAPPRLISSTL
jgi:hypothetical protein